MSFTDLMSSGRGPGVIGFLIAMLIILGFGALLTLAFDEGSQGAHISIEAVIRNQGKDIENYVLQSEAGNKRLAKAAARIEDDKKSRRLKVQNQSLATGVQAAETRAKAAHSVVAKQTEVFENYKDQYRAHVRGLAKGRVYDQLETQAGTVYKNVNIRDVTPVGIQIRHDDGHKRIAFEELPQEMQDHFQFDPKQKDRALKAEAAQRIELESAVAITDQAAEVQAAKQKIKGTAIAKEKINREIAGINAQIQTLQGEVAKLRAQMAQAGDAANAARGNGKIHVNKSGAISGNIRAKENRIATLQAELNQLRARLL